MNSQQRCAATVAAAEATAWLDEYGQFGAASFRRPDRLLGSMQAAPQKRRVAPARKRKETS